VRFFFFFFEIKVTERKNVSKTEDVPAHHVLTFDPSTTKGNITFLKVFKRVSDSDSARLQTNRGNYVFKTERMLEQHLTTIFIWKHEGWAEGQKGYEDDDKTKATRIEKFQASLNDVDVDRFVGVVITRLQNEHLLGDIDVDTVWMALGPSLKEKLAKKNGSIEAGG
jgi:hypothetical protein